jgi:hypothetical protein
MPAPAEPKQTPWWNAPWVVGMGCGLAFLVLGLFVGDLPRLLVALGAAGIVVLVGAVALAMRTVHRWRARLRRVFGRIEELELESLRTKHELTQLRTRILEVALFDVIYEGVDKGWTFEPGADGLECTAPDGAKALLPYDGINWYIATTVLTAASPEHWDAGWYPPVLSQAAVATKLGTDAKLRLDKLEAQLDRLRAGTDPKRAEALLSFVRANSASQK